MDGTRFKSPYSLVDGNKEVNDYSQEFVDRVNNTAKKIWDNRGKLGFKLKEKFKITPKVVSPIDNTGNGG